VLSEEIAHHVEEEEQRRGHMLGDKMAAEKTRLMAAYKSGGLPRPETPTLKATTIARPANGCTVRETRRRGQRQPSRWPFCPVPSLTGRQSGHDPLLRSLSRFRTCWGRWRGTRPMARIGNMTFWVGPTWSHPHF
jgi:hypothetical protein